MIQTNTLFSCSVTNQAQLPPVIVIANPDNRTSLPCRVVVNGNVLWTHYGIMTTSSPRNISINGRILNQLADRYALGDSKEDYHSLIILRTTPSDVGLYECRESNGYGHSHYVMLMMGIMRVLVSFSPCTYATSCTT